MEINAVVKNLRGGNLIKTNVKKINGVFTACLENVILTVGVRVNVFVDA